MACQGCAESLERAAGTIRELNRFGADVLPAFPELHSWEQLANLLVQLGGQLRMAKSRQDTAYEMSPTNPTY